MLQNTYSREIKSLKDYVIAISIVIIFSYLYVALANGDSVIVWGREDGFFEWLTAIFYFFAFIFLLLTFRKNRNVFLLLLAIVMFIGAGEEISWGQRIFGFATPEALNKVNVQHEFNIHNIATFNEVDIHHVKKHGLQRLLEIDFLLKLFGITFGIILPFCVSNFKFVSKLIQNLKVPVPPISIGIFFAISWLSFKLACKMIPHEADMSVEGHYQKIINAAEEIYEFVGSFILCMIALYFYQNRKKDIMGKDFKTYHIVAASQNETVQQMNTLAL